MARGEAATGSADAVLAWRGQLNRPEMAAAALANADYGDALDAALGNASPADPVTLNAMRAALGLPAASQPAGRPAASSLAQELGLR